ncbi:MAG: pilus assembly FimT family protein [Planctomycetota bacterium]|jgi:type II secretory pathway pseudopilin PulG
MVEEADIRDSYSMANALLSTSRRIRKLPVSANAHPRYGRKERAAFTLMELLVVMSLIMVLLGLGVGMFMRLRKSYAFPAEVSLLRTVIRKARNFALTKGVGATVVIDPWRNEARACGIRTSGYWSFDTETAGGAGPAASGAYGYDGTLSGVNWIYGAFGGAYDFPDGADAYIEVEDPGAGIFDDVTGIHISLWVKPADLKAIMASEEGEDGEPVEEVDLAPFTLIAKQPSYCLSILEDFSLEFSVSSEHNRIRTRPGIVFPNRWNKIEVTYDGRIENELDRLRIIANGIECFELYAFVLGPKVYFRSPEGISEIDGDKISKMMPDRVPRTEQPLTISSGSGLVSFVGAIDEVSVSVVVSDEVVRFSEGRLKGHLQEIHFDKRGRLDSAYHNEPVFIQITNDEFYKPPKPLWHDQEEIAKRDESPGAGLTPEIPPAAPAGGASASPAQGLTSNGSNPKTYSYPRTREGARTKTIVVELSGTVSSRKTETQERLPDDAYDGVKDF